MLDPQVSSEMSVAVPYTKFTAVTQRTLVPSGTRAATSIRGPGQYPAGSEWMVPADRGLGQ